MTFHRIVKTGVAQGVTQNRHLAMIQGISQCRGVSQQFFRTALLRAFSFQIFIQCKNRAFDDIQLMNNKVRGIVTVGF